MKTNIAGKYTCPFTGMSENMNVRGMCLGGGESGCHFWDEEANTCQEIVKVQLQREANILLREIKSLLTKNKPVVAQAKKVYPREPQQNPSADYIKSISDSKKEKQ